MSTVFADTFYFLALCNRADQAHRKSVEYSRQNREFVVTTAWVLVELADALSRPATRNQTAAFIQSLGSLPNVRVIPASQPLFDRGLDLYAHRSDKDWSLTDCLSFVCMEDEGLNRALTGDVHFQQAGYQALLL